MMDKEDAKMTLEKTVEMMSSADFKERFKAEYFQLTVRLDKLNSMLDKWRKNELNFTPKCPFWLLSLQADIMTAYMKVLDQRAEIEGVFDKEDNKETENERKIKIFISQNPCFKTRENLEKERADAIEWITTMFNNKDKFLICKNAIIHTDLMSDETAKKNIEILSTLEDECDIVIFVGNWEESDGTKNEYKLAIEKHLTIFFIDGSEPISIEMTDY